MSGQSDITRISLTNAPDAVRSSLGHWLSELSTTQAAWVAGQCSDTPGTAFFCGYQAAMRCLDPSLQPSLWAAFCISEKGLKSLKEMSCNLDAQGFLSGQKSHAMLAGQGLDLCYVVARSGAELVCLQVDMQTPGVEIGQAGKPQPFMPDLPHLPLVFTLVSGHFFSSEADERLNKPFRYWEDVHGLLALAGWMASWLREGQNPELVEAAERLQQIFTATPGGYCVLALDAVDLLFNLMEKAAGGMPEPQRLLWQRDRMLLVFTQPLRQKIRAKISG